MQQCNKCLKTKDFIDFLFRVDSNSYRKSCRECCNTQRSERRKTNLVEVKKKEKKSREKYKEYYSEYRQENKEKIAIARKPYDKKHKKIYYSINKTLINERTRKLYKNNINYRLSLLLRGRLRSAINGKVKNGSAVRDLGCTLEELKLYLESRFQDGMSWDNYGFYGWHIDHIIPLSSFDLTDENELKKAVHYTNLQPLWAIDNFKKGDR